MPATTARFQNGHELDESARGPTVERSANRCAVGELSRRRRRFRFQGRSHASTDERAKKNGEDQEMKIALTGGNGFIGSHVLD